MKEIFKFSAKLCICVCFALVCAVLALEISCYHFAGLTGFVFGGLLAASVTNLFD